MKSSSTDFTPAKEKRGTAGWNLPMFLPRARAWEAVSTPSVSARPLRREPTWSGVLTRPLARAIPPSLRHETLIAIKGLHTVLFFSIAAALLLTLVDGLRGRPTRRTAIAGGIVGGESLVYLSNNQVCPFTPLAEEFGAASGSVVDMYLPALVARHTPLVAGSAALVALVTNIAALQRGRRIRP